MCKHLRRAAIVIVMAVTVGMTASGSVASAPRCHWHHYKRAGINYYVQVCAMPKPHRRKVDKRWTTAGPGNSPAPRIG